MIFEKTTDSLLLQTRNPWYGLGLSFGLTNAKNCSKLRTVKTPDHDRLFTVASNLKACLTTELLEPDRRNIAYSSFGKLKSRGTFQRSVVIRAFFGARSVQERIPKVSALRVHS